MTSGMRFVVGLLVVLVGVAGSANADGLDLRTILDINGNANVDTDEGDASVDAGARGGLDGSVDTADADVDSVTSSVDGSVGGSLDAAGDGELGILDSLSVRIQAMWSAVLGIFADAGDADASAGADGALAGDVTVDGESVNADAVGSAAGDVTGGTDDATATLGGDATSALSGTLDS